MSEKKTGHPLYYFFALLVLVGVFLAVSQLLSIVILALLQEGSFSENITNMIFSAGALDDMPVNNLKFIQIFSMAFSFIIPPIIISRMRDRSTFGIYNLSKAPRDYKVLIALAVIVCFLPFIAYSGWLNMQMVLPESWSWLELWMKEMEEMSAGLIEKFLLDVGPLGLLLNLFMIAILPGFAEELVFRGGLQKFFQEFLARFWNENISGHIAVWFIAIIFSAFHFQFYGFLPRFILGVILGYLFLFSKNLWYPIIAHAVFNGVQVIGAYFMPEEMLNQDLETMQMPIWIALISLALGSLVLYSYKNSVQPKVDEPKNEWIA